MVWPNEKAHCSDITAFPVLVRGVTRNKREEIVVDVCYDQCQEYEGNFLSSVNRYRVWSSTLIFYRNRT